jgi:hypothetical protein
VRQPGITGPGPGPHSRKLLLITDFFTVDAYSIHTPWTRPAFQVPAAGPLWVPLLASDNQYMFLAFNLFYHGKYPEVPFLLFDFCACNK